MKQSLLRKLTLFLTIVMSLFMFAACSHQHNWSDATCTAPKTCTVCAVTEGAALGHSFADATCTAPKTCTVCDATEGNALGHSYADATCTAPKTCTVCDATEGDALGHTFADATCTAPKTCTVCDATEGNALGHTFVDATCTAPKTCTVCDATEVAALGHTFADATCTAPKTCTVCGATEGNALGHTFADATCTAPKTCKVCGATKGNALGHDINTKTSKCKRCGAFEYNIEYAVRGILKQTTNWANATFESYEILNIYYVLDDSCTCDYCRKGDYAGDPYLTGIVFLEYTLDGEKNTTLDIFGVHKNIDEAADTHYSLVSNVQECYYYSIGNELESVRAADYSFYYDENDLIRIDISKVVG